MKKVSAGLRRSPASRLFRTARLASLTIRRNYVHTSALSRFLDTHVALDFVNKVSLKQMLILLIDVRERPLKLRIDLVPIVTDLSA
jgi:hypothetical protein